jgi:hypothetical protein
MRAIHIGLDKPDELDEPDDIFACGAGIGTGGAAGSGGIASAPVFVVDDVDGSLSATAIALPPRMNAS